MKKLLVVLVAFGTFNFFTPLTAQAASVAFDSSASGVSGINLHVGDETVSFTVNTGDYLYVIVNTDGSSLTGGEITHVRWNGVDLTKGPEVAASNGSRTSSIWGTSTPQTGTFNVVASSGSANINHVAVSVQSYTGVTTLFDSQNTTANNLTNNGTALTVSTTVVGSGSWLVCGYDSADDGAPTGSNITRRTLPAQQFASGDTNGVVGTGSQSCIWNQTGSGGTVIGTVVSIAPVLSSFNPWQFWAL